MPKKPTPEELRLTFAENAKSFLALSPEKAKSVIIRLDALAERFEHNRILIENIGIVCEVLMSHESDEVREALSKSQSLQLFPSLQENLDIKDSEKRAIAKALEDENSTRKRQRLALKTLGLTLEIDYY